MDKTGGPAFPIAFQELDGSGMPRTEMYAHDGMSLRDWFAGQALAGLIASPISVRGTKDGSPLTELTFARQAYEFADALLKARERD